MNIFDKNGIELNAQCSVDEEDGVYGLILESWGPSHRNRDYNVALDCIIERLIDSRIDNVVVYIASSAARKHISYLDERKIHPEEYYSLVGGSPRKLRQKLCSYLAYFSRTGKKDVPLGNRTKRIIISVPGINSGDFWGAIVNGESLELLQPTDDENVLNKRVSRLLKKTLREPEGQNVPKSVERLQKVYARDPAVKGWILQKSKGSCENCGENAPFFLNDGSPYLEVHHVIPLSSAGADTISNCVALCPNCHRAMHFSQDAKEMIEVLYSKVERLQK
ncbi:HNH endonuclease [Pantoea coffeiphila]|uniref:Restriction endonuclease n=1 Tax=Pantoea coffeiphila TaxID=1465635 RepID=A0A2S9I8A3_9GAMM|nr:HNH endonuclease signature motif containing protein [Pantoea coffeiphila]PRD14006.1 restriction endonuclease [Pantoea coffeiphila]